MPSLEYILSNEPVLQIEIANLKSGGDVSIEVQQFFNHTDRFKQIQQKIMTLYFELSRLGPLETSAREELTAQLDKLYAQEKDFKIQLLEYARTIYKIRDAKSPQIARLKQYLIEGKLNDSDKLLDPSVLEQTQRELSSLAEVENNLQVVYEKLSANAQEFLVKAYLTVLNFESPARYPKSLEYFEKCLVSSRRALTYPFELCVVLVNYGKFLEDNHDSDRAFVLHEEALLLLRSLAQDNPQEHELDLAITLGNVACIQMQSGRLGEATAGFEEFLSILDRQDRKDEKFVCSLALACMNYAELQHRLQNFDVALEICSKGIEEAMVGVEQEFYNCLPLLIRLLSNSALMLMKTNDVEMAKLNYDSGVDLLTSILDNDQVGFSQDAIGYFGDAANFYCDLQDYVTANRLLERAFEYNEQLGLANSRQVYLSQKVFLLGQFARVEIATRQFTKAQAHIEEAERIYEGLSDSLPQKLLNKRLNFLTSVARFYMDMHRLTDAERHLLGAAALVRKMADISFKLHSPLLITALGNLAALYQRANNFPKCEALQAEILYFIDDLNVLPEDSIDRAKELNAIGETRRLKKDLAGAEEIFTKVIGCFHKILEGNEGHYRDLYAKVLNNLSLVYWEQGATAKALKFAEESVLNLKMAYEEQPLIHESDLAIAMHNLAAIYTQDNNHQKAKDYYEQALVIQRKLANEHPLVYRSHLAETLSNLGDLNRKMNDNTVAEQQLSEALAIREALSQINPDVFKIKLAETNLNIGNVYLKKKEIKNAEQAYLKAYKIYSELLQKNIPESRVALSVTTMNLGLLYSNYDFRPAEAIRYARETITLASPVAATVAQARNSLETANLIIQVIQPLSA